MMNTLKNKNFQIFALIGPVTFLIYAKPILNAAIHAAYTVYLTVGG